MSISEPATPAVGIRHATFCHTRFARIDVQLSNYFRFAAQRAQDSTDALAIGCKAGLRATPVREPSDDGQAP